MLAFKKKKKKCNDKATHNDKRRGGNKEEREEKKKKESKKRSVTYHRRAAFFFFSDVELRSKLSMQESQRWKQYQQKKKAKKILQCFACYTHVLFFFFLLYFQCECSRNSCQATTLAERCLIFSTFLCVVSRFFFFFFFRFFSFAFSVVCDGCVNASLSTFFSRLSLSSLFILRIFFFPPFFLLICFPAFIVPFFFKYLTQKKKKIPKTYAC